ncbi:WXG100 family type VII secretion target [Nocardiopsis synnemataformans]|uniref:WXG100 family type VII secretion target n=1 Tax=Nocardiopsis synnemataformans TaxID=61305 RepID=UPI003EB847CB
MSINGFSVTYAHVNDVTDELRAQTVKVQNQLEQLNMTMQSLQSQLEGAMFTEYQNKYRSWQYNVADMNTLLVKAENALKEISNDYSSTDSREAMNWQALL